MKKIRAILFLLGIWCVALLVLRMCGINMYRDKSWTWSIIVAIVGVLYDVYVIVRWKYGAKIKAKLNKKFLHPDDDEEYDDDDDDEADGKASKKKAEEDEDDA